ncbi:hypothetical protein ND436_002750 [Neisseria gonorrhoeae]|nr:hypothetical protein [Neisseria gonorrhoeae]UYP52464.1 hypothetical protein ND436_002750 [Neisseria gonorrhoeae]
MRGREWGFCSSDCCLPRQGGVLGAVWASLRERSSPVQAVLEALFLQSRRRYGGAVRAAGSGVDVRGGGVFAGMMTGHALDTVRGCAKVLRGYLGGLAEKLTGVKDEGLRMEKIDFERYRGA